MTATLAMATLASGGNLAGAATKIWTGASSATWSTSGNWNAGGAPGSSDDVVFNSSSSNKPATITGSTTINSLSLQPGYTGTITIDSAQVLTINGNFAVMDGLVGYWRFDEGSGTTAYDTSGAGNNLSHVASNSPSFTATVPTTIFANPYGHSFANGNGLEIANWQNTTLKSSGDWTIAAWVQKTSTFGTSDCGVGTGIKGAEILNAGNDFGLRLCDNGKLRAFKDTSGGYTDCVSSGTFTANGSTWYHMAATNSGSTLKVFINGVETSCSSTGTQTFATGTLRVGLHNSGTGYNFIGKMDDVRVYNRGISATEVKALAAGYHPAANYSKSLTGGTITVSGDMAITGTDVDFGTTAVNVAGNFYNIGSATSGSSTITLNGSSAKDIAGLGGWLHGLTIGGSATRTLRDRLWVSGTLAVSGGTLDMSNKVVLAGTVNQTSGSITSTGSTMVIGSSSSSNVNVTSTLNTLRFEDPTETSLVAYWKFDELQGDTARNSAASNNTATSYDNPTWITTGPSAIDFENGGAVQFDATDDYFDVSSPSFPAPNAAHTVAAWVSVPSLGTSRTILEYVDGSTNGNRFGIGNSGTEYQIFQDWTANAQIVGVAAMGYGLNTWNHLAYTYDGTTHRLYVNGTEVDTSTVSAPSGAITSVRIGNRNTDAEYFNGKVDDLRVYNVALTAAQISRLAAGKHADTGGTATYTLTGTTATSGDLIIDSGSLASGSQSISVGGSWTNDGYPYTGTGTVSFTSTTTGKTILSNGQQFGAVSFTGSGGGWTLSDRLWSDGALSISNGTLNTGNFIVHAGTINKTGGTFTLGTSTVIIDSISDQTLTSSTAFNTLRIEPTFETGLVAYWKFDENAESSVRNSAGSGNTGTLAGDTVWYTSSLPALLNKFDNAAALDFDGTTDYVDIASLTSIPAVNTAFSVSLWANWDNDGNSDEFIELMNGASGLRIGTTGNKVSARRGNGTTVLAETAANAYSDGNWHHVVYTYNPTGTTSKLYVDGAAVTSTTNAADAVTPNAIRIGAHSDGSASFAGKLDDVRIYSVELTQAEVSRLYGGNYAGRGGGATFTLGTDTTASNLQVDSGTLTAASGNDLTVNGTTTASEVKTGAGLTIGGSAGVFSYNLQVNGTLTMNATSGSLSMANTRSLLIDGSLVTSTGTSTPKPTIKSVSGTYTFSVGTSATSTPTLNINGLAVQNTTTAGMFINQTSGATTTFTRFDNIDFSAGTTGSPSYLLHIAHNTLTLHANGLTFDTTGTSADTNVYLEDRNGAGNDVRMYIGGTCAGAESDCEAYDLDDDTAGIMSTSFDGVPDDAGNDGAVVQWLYRSYADVGGTIESFPSVAFSWTTFAFRGTYVLTNNTTGGDYLIKRDNDGALYHASATWMLPNGEDFRGRPLWVHDTGGGVYYVYVLSTAGRVYKLRDDGNSFTQLASFHDGGSASGASSLISDSTNLYWTGNTSGGVASAFKLPQSNLMGVSTRAINASTAAPSLFTVSGTKYLFTATSGRAYKINTDFSPVSETLLAALTTVYSRATVVAGRVLFIDNSGMLWVLNASTMAHTSYYQDTGSHSGTCAAAGNCEARNLYYDVLNNRAYWGDKDGHVYAVNVSSSWVAPATAGTLMWASPIAMTSAVFVTAPLYRDGVIAIGSTTGKVYFIDQRTAMATSPATNSLIRTYNFGSSVAINNISFDHDGNQYVIATSDGKLYYVAASLVDDGDAFD